ncbi:hypothetical protein GGF46_004176 [Coemansia sp. RSA 552]|nr:hypothetical protein GGF46_004176 [Coemansia sp. RSA 552]
MGSKQAAGSGVQRTIAFISDKADVGPDLPAHGQGAEDSDGSSGFNDKVQAGEGSTGSKAKSVDITEHLLSLEQVCTKYRVQVNAERPQDSQGLGAAQAAQLLAEHGSNTLTPPKKKSALKKFLGCLLTLFNLMLIVAGVLVYVLLAIDYKDNKSSIYMGAILIAVAFLNAGIEWYQEHKSENTLAALLQMIPATTHVIREGNLAAMPAANVVVGDVVFIRMGDKIPADSYIFASNELKVDNS